MKLSEIRGQDGAVRVLRGALRTGRIASAYLFSGSRGVGKRTTARAFAAALLCEGARLAERSPPGDDGCGSCRSCRKLAHGTHPDFVELVVPPDKKEIPVDLVRQEILAHLAYTPYESTRRVVLLPAAEDLSDSAASSLLKSLEEPGTHTHFVLCSGEAHRLLATIRSRCQEVRFVPLADAIVVELLVARGAPAGEARRAAAFAAGSPGLALERLGGDLAARVEAAERLEDAAARGLRPLVEVAGQVAKQKDALPEVLEAWLLLRRDLLRAGEGAPDEKLLVARDPAAIRRRALSLSPEARVRGLEAVHAAILALERWANPELVLDRAMLEIADA